MKKVLVTLVLVMTLGVSVYGAQNETYIED